MRMKQFLFNAAINFKIFISSLVNLLNPIFRKKNLNKRYMPFFRLFFYLTDIIK